MGVSSAEWGFSNFSISERKAIGGTVKPRFRSEEIQGRAPRLSSGNLGQNLLGSPLLARPRGDKNRTTIRGHCVHCQLLSSGLVFGLQYQMVRHYHPNFSKLHTYQGLFQQIIPCMVRYNFIYSHEYIYIIGFKR